MQEKPNWSTKIGYPKRQGEQVIYYDLLPLYVIMIIINFIGNGKKLEGDQSPASAP